VHSSQPVGEFCTRLDLDIGAEPAQHIIEQRNLLVGVTARTGRKEIGDPVNDSDAVG
jgi:hypothetical protein